MEAPDPFDQFDSIHPLQCNVQDHQIWLSSCDLTQRFSRAVCLSTDLEVAFSIYQLGESFAQNGLFVHQYQLSLPLLERLIILEFHSSTHRQAPFRTGFVKRLIKMPLSGRIFSKLSSRSERA